MSLIPKRVSFSPESTQSEQPSKYRTVRFTFNPCIDRLDHVLFLMVHLELGIVGKRPTQHLEHVTVEVRFQDTAVAALDKTFGKTYTTSIYKQAFEYSKPLANHLQSLFDGQQKDLFRKSFERCVAVYGKESPVLPALASWPKGDQLLRWALAPSSGVWPPETSSILRPAYQKYCQKYRALQSP